MIPIVEVIGYIFGFPRGSNIITSSARGISPVAPAKVNSVKFTNASVFNMGTSISTNRISTAIVSNLVTDVLRISYSGINAVKPFTALVSNLVTDISWIRYSGVKLVPIGSTLYLQNASVFNMGTSISTNRISTAIVSNLVTDVLRISYSGISANRTGITQLQLIQFWS